MKRIVVLSSLAFGFTLAFLVAQRLSDQAMAVIVGSVIGVAASIPMTALVLWLMLRQRVAPAPPPARYEPPRHEEPRIMIVQPPAYPAQPAQVLPPAGYSAPMFSPTMARAPREFKIVGEEDLEDQDS